MDNKSLSLIKWKCQYHIVFIPKYRKKQLYGQLKRDVREIISTLCKYKVLLIAMIELYSVQKVVMEIKLRVLTGEVVISGVHMSNLLLHI